MRIGGGHNVSIRSDPWLRDKHNRYITSGLNDDLVDKTVDQLMIPDQQIWNVNMIDGMFNSRDKELILQIPLSRSVNVDSWYWIFNPKGRYTVRSGYRL